MLIHRQTHVQHIKISSLWSSVIPTMLEKVASNDSTNNKRQQSPIGRQYIYTDHGSLMDGCFFYHTS